MYYCIYQQHHLKYQNNFFLNQRITVRPSVCALVALSVDTHKQLSSSLFYIELLYFNI